MGEESPHYATTLNNLAGYYCDIGDYGQAHSLYLQCREIRKKVLGEEHPTYAITLNCLALYYQAVGDFVRAETLLIRLVSRICG